MSLTKDGFYKSFSGAIGNNNYLLEAGGGHIAWGNAANQIPYSNGTVNTSLNADMTDGLHVHTGRNNEANKIVRTDGSGYIQAGYINTNVGTEDGLAWSRVFFEYNNDGYIRKASISRAKTVFFGGQVGSPSVPIYWTGSAFATCIVSFGNSSYGEHDANNINDNGIKYYTSNGPSTSLGATTSDGALYSQAYNTSWVGQIAQDYRNGGLYVRGKNNGTWQSWYRVWDNRTTYVSGGKGYIGGTEITQVNNSDTVDGYHANRFAFTYNSVNYGGSSGVTVNDLVTNGVSNASHGMIYAATDNPVGAANWVHVWSQQWTIGTTSSWVSQIALGVQQGTGMWYRTTSGNVVGRGWTRVLDSSNWTSYGDGRYLLRLRRANLNISSTDAGMVPPALLELKNGYPIYTDPEFASGNNSISVYNNSGGTAVTITRQADSTAGNSSGYVLKVHSAASSASPYGGGWYFATGGVVSRVYVCIFRAKIPSGYSVVFHTNSIGSGANSGWLTEQAGTGKWEWYAYMVEFGTSPSSTFFFTLNSAAAVDWYLSYANVIWINNNAYDGLRTRYSDEAAGARYIFDRSNGTATYSNYGASGLGWGSITWLTCWNGYELRAISKAEMANTTIVNQNISSNADYPLVWSNRQTTTNDQGNQLYKSYDYLLYNPSTKVLRNDGPLWLRPDRDATLKIYSGKITDGYSDGFICMQTSIDGTDGQSHSHPTNYGARCVIALQPRGGEVYIGKTITAASTSADTTYKLNVGGHGNFDGNIWARGSGVYLRIGPQNGTYAHYETNAGTSHWFNKRIDVNGAIWRYNTNYGIADDGRFYALAMYANRSASSTDGGVSLYSDSDPMTYGIAFRGTGTYGKLQGVQSNWATYLTMSDTVDRGWIFRRGSTNVLAIDGYGTLNRFYTYRLRLPGATGKAVGWYQMCRVSGLDGYFNFNLLMSGGWNTGAPTMALCNLACYHTTPVMTQIAGQNNGVITKIRLRNISGGDYYLDVYQAYGYTSSNAMADMYFLINGSVRVTEIAEPTAVTSATGGTELDIQNIKGHLVNIENAYWANLQVQTSSSTSTTPQFGSVGIGTNARTDALLTLPANNVQINFRPDHGSYNAKIEYMTSGNEALVFGTQNSVTSFIFANGLNLENRSDYQNLGNVSLQIKSNKVSIGAPVRGDSDSQTASLYVNGNVGIGTNIPSYTLDIRGTTRSTNRIYANEWIQFDNYTGIYSPNNSAHFYPNNSTSYGQWLMQGARGGYSGIQFGTNTGYMTIMDNQEDKGLYEEDWNWILYFNRRNKKLSFRTSSDLGADNNFNGSLTAWNYRIYGSAQAFNCNDVTCTGLWYYTSNGPSTNVLDVCNGGIAMTTGDASLYSQAYSTSWVSQIAQDYRNGRLFVRSRNNGTWMPWLNVINNKSHYGTQRSNAYYKISINSYTSWMLSFIIRVYQSYTHYDICVSGYNYGSNHWYSPNATMITSTTTSITVYFGYDSDYHLWVAIPGASYTGIDIVECTNGYTQTNLTLQELFTITGVSSIPTTQQTSVIAYTPWSMQNRPYWANVQVSNTSSTSTSPTFSTCYTSNWFRSTGNTGWYSESYGGGWYMTDSTWIRTYSSKSVYSGSGIIRSDNAVWGNSVVINSNWIGFYNAVQGSTRYGYIQADANRMYFRKENGVNTYHFDFGGHGLFSGNLCVTEYAGIGIPPASVGLGRLVFPENNVAINFRINNSSYYSKIQYMTNGNEALVFANTNAVTSFIFKCGYNLSNSSDWQSSAIGTPSIQIKNQSLYVNTAIASGSTPGYNFYVTGTSYFSTYIYYDVANQDYTLDHIYASNDRYIRPMAIGTFLNKLWWANIHVSTSSNTWTEPTLGRIYVQPHQGSWVSGMTTNPSIWYYSQNAIDASSYWAFYAMKSSSSHVINFGGLGNNIGFVGYFAGRTANSYDWTFWCDTSTGIWTASKQLRAVGFYHTSYGSPTYLLRSDGGVAAFNWSGQSGTPTWVWGGNSQHTYYVYNPANFDVYSAAKLRITGYQTNGLSFYQTDSSFDGSPASSWAHYIISNHGDGASYYHYTLRLPFWGPPQYRRQEGSTSSVTQWYTFITTENGYWANQPIQTASSTATNPQFNSVNVGGTSTSYGAYLASGKRLYIEGTESNAIYTEHHSDGHISTNSPESNAAIRHGFVFKWYDTYWKIGNVRGGSTNSAGFGIGYYAGSQLSLLVKPDLCGTNIYGKTTNNDSNAALRVIKGWDCGNRATYDTMIISSNDCTSLRLIEADGTCTGISAGDSKSILATTHNLQFWTGGSNTGLIYAGMSGTFRFGIYYNNFDAWVERGLRVNASGSTWTHNPVSSNSGVCIFADSNGMNTYIHMKPNNQSYFWGLGTYYEGSGFGYNRNLFIYQAPISGTNEVNNCYIFRGVSYGGQGQSYVATCEGNTYNLVIVGVFLLYKTVYFNDSYRTNWYISTSYGMTTFTINNTCDLAGWEDGSNWYTAKKNIVVYASGCRNSDYSNKGTPFVVSCTASFLADDEEGKMHPGGGTCGGNWGIEVTAVPLAVGRNQYSSYSSHGGRYIYVDVKTLDGSWNHRCITGDAYVSSSLGPILVTCFGYMT